MQWQIQRCRILQQFLSDNGGWEQDYDIVKLYLCLQVGNAQLAGAKAAIVYDNQIDDYFLMVANDSSASSIYIPGLSIPRKVGQLLISSTQVLESKRCGSIHLLRA